MKPIRLMIVDDHELVRLGVRAAADGVDDIDVVGDYENAEAALAALESLNPDVLLMGVDMTGMDGVHACRHVRGILPDVRVVMLTSHSDEETVMASIMAGAAGYLMKNIKVAELFRDLRTVADGESLLHPAVTRGVLDRFKALTTDEEERHHAPHTPPDAPDALSRRESEVFLLVVEGCTNKDIADKLVISENTARNHVSHILHKLGLTRRSQAAAFGS